MEDQAEDMLSADTPSSSDIDDKLQKLAKTKYASEALVTDGRKEKFSQSVVKKSQIADYESQLSSDWR